MFNDSSRIFIFLQEICRSGFLTRNFNDFLAGVTVPFVYSDFLDVNCKQPILNGKFEAQNKFAYQIYISLAKFYLLASPMSSNNLILK